MKKGETKTTQSEYFVAYMLKSSLVGGGDELMRDTSLEVLEQKAKEAVAHDPKLEIVIVKTNASVKEEVVAIVNSATVGNAPSIFGDKSI